MFMFGIFIDDIDQTFHTVMFQLTLDESATELEVDERFSTSPFFEVLVESQVDWLMGMIAFHNTGGLYELSCGSLS